MMDEKELVIELDKELTSDAEKNQLESDARLEEYRELDRKYEDMEKRDRHET